MDDQQAHSSSCIPPDGATSSDHESELYPSFTETEFVAPGPIRKRRFSSARIQPTRVKKVMQSDEEIGRMVASVPVAIGSAMELFAEKLISSAAQCLNSSATKTLSPLHIKYAMYKNPEFSFLEGLLKDVPLPRFNFDSQPPNEQIYAHSNSLGVTNNANYLTTNFCQYNIAPPKQVEPPKKIQKEPPKKETDNGFVKRKRGRPPKIRPPEQSSISQIFTVAPQESCIKNEMCNQTPNNFNLMDLSAQQFSCQKPTRTSI